MQVLKVLQQNAYGVLELCQVFDIRQSAMSHHLKILANAGLVATRREGTTIFYRRNETHPDTDLQPLQQVCFKLLMKRPWIRAFAAGWSRSIRSARRPRWLSLTRMPSALKRTRILLPAGQTTATALRAFLIAASAKTQSALEIGPGYGQFLGKLSSRFDQVTALDNSAEMLERCRSTCQRAGARQY